MQWLASCQLYSVLVFLISFSATDAIHRSSDRQIWRGRSNNFKRVDRSEREVAHLLISWTLVKSLHYCHWDHSVALDLKRLGCVNRWLYMNTSVEPLQSGFKMVYHECSMSCIDAIARLQVVDIIILLLVFFLLHSTDRTTDQILKAMRAKGELCLL